MESGSERRALLTTALTTNSILRGLNTLRWPAGQCLPHKHEAQGWDLTLAIAAWACNPALCGVGNRRVAGAQLASQSNWNGKL